jgi:hypothetical protein
MDLITDNLYLGSILAAQDQERLQQASVKCVLNVTVGTRCYFQDDKELGIEYHRISYDRRVECDRNIVWIVLLVLCLILRLMDEEEAPLHQHLDEAIQFIERAMERDVTVLVHWCDYILYYLIIYFVVCCCKSSSSIVIICFVSIPCLHFVCFVLCLLLLFSLNRLFRFVCFLWFASVFACLLFVDVIAKL